VYLILDFPDSALVPYCPTLLQYASLRGPMLITLRLFCRLPVLQCVVTYNAALFQGQGTIWSLSCVGWRFSGDRPMRPDTLSLTITLPNEQRILVPHAIVRWSREQGFAVENVVRSSRACSAQALREAIGTGTDGECPMSDDWGMSFRFPIALVLSFVCFAVPVWADFQAGMDANNRGDYATALREWRLLAEQGDALAQYNLGMLYRKGRGVPQDDVQARQWYEKAAVQGQAKAQFSLGTLYFNGEGAPKDYRQALRWFRLAADQGEAVAQTKIAIMYDDGQGVPHDIVQAYKWYSLAATNGDKPAAELRDTAAKQMTPAQIAEAQKLAQEWKPKSK